MPSVPVETLREEITNEKAIRIGNALGIDWSMVELEQFRMGVETELEHFATIHRLSPKWPMQQMGLAAGMIALDHLLEIPDYYSRLLKMEREAMSEQLGEQDTLAYVHRLG